MLKQITLLSLIVLNFTSQPVCGGNTFIPLCESEAKQRETAQRAAMASAAFARLAAGERIGTQERDEESSTLETLLSLPPNFEVMRAILQAERLEGMRTRYLQWTTLDPVLTETERSFYMLRLIHLREMNVLKPTIYQRVKMNRVLAELQDKTRLRSFLGTFQFTHNICTSLLSPMTLLEFARRHS